MMDMVRKHCAPGSGNYETAEACVNRTHEMLRDFKKVVFNFVSQAALHLDHPLIGLQGTSKR